MAFQGNCKNARHLSKRFKYSPITNLHLFLYNVTKTKEGGLILLWVLSKEVLRFQVPTQIYFISP